MCTTPPRCRGQARLRVGAQGAPAVTQTVRLELGRHFLELEVKSEANAPATVNFELTVEDAERPVLRVSSVRVEYLGLN